MNKAEMIFDSYNKVIKESCHRIVESIKDINDYKTREDELHRLLDAELATWEQTPSEEFGGESPEDFFSKISDFDAAVEMFKKGALECDDGIPDSLERKLRSFGEVAVDQLLSLACDKSMLENEDSFLIPLVSIRLLGDWKVEKAVVPLIDIVMGCGDKSEPVILEEVSTTLGSIGAAAVEPAVKAIEAHATPDCAKDCLLDAITLAGKSYKSDAIYRCLKNAFLKLDNKIMGAARLGTYGDSRAIPALRGYVEKNLRSIDRETYWEIKSVVQRLGGSMEDFDAAF